MSTSSRPQTRTSFVRAQVASLVATAVDFGMTYVFKDVLGWWYVLATGLGAFLGTVVNFLMGRYWVFESKERKMWRQGMRYGLISVGSLILNTFGIWVWVELTSEAWVYPAKVVIGVFVGMTWNFFMQKNFVYK